MYWGFSYFPMDSITPALEYLKYSPSWVVVCVCVERGSGSRLRGVRIRRGLYFRKFTTATRKQLLLPFHKSCCEKVNRGLQYLGMIC